MSFSVSTEAPASPSPVGRCGRLLFLGDMAATGFGTVTLDLGKALLDQGEDVRFLSLNETTEIPEPFGSRTARLGDPHGWLAASAVRSKLENMTSGGLFEDGWKPDALFLLGDIGSLIESQIAEIIPFGFPTYHYAAVEGIGLPPSWAGWWRRFTPIAMSEFVAEQMEKLIGYKPPVVYHGIDTETFHPVSDARPIVWRGAKNLSVIRSKREAKAAFGFSPDQIVILRTDANVVRKAYFELYWALAPVIERNPQAIFACHCKVRDFGGDMDDMRSHFPEHVRKRMGPLGLRERFQSVPRAVLATLYNAADIYVSNSCEGFGLTIAEAMACGIPVVGQDFSSVPEVIGDAGILVPPGRLFPNIYAHWWAVADGKKLGEAVESLITSAGKRRDLGEKGPPRVREKFQWSLAAEQMAAIIGTKVTA